MPVIIPVLTAQDANVACAGLDCLDSVLSPVAAGSKGQQVSAAMRVDTFFFTDCPERSGEVPVNPSLRCEARPPFVKLRRNSVNRGFNDNAAIRGAWTTPKGPHMRASVSIVNPAAPQGLEQ